MRDTRCSWLMFATPAVTLVMGVTLLARSEFVTIDVAGAASNQVLNVNPRGDLVGAFVGTDRRTHGFSLV
ncbi:MAG: hypothetical protein ACT4P5_19905, partial [Armatimonadota bacterium]